MSVRLTVDVFSGRPNPTVELGQDEIGQYDLRTRLQPDRALEGELAQPPPESVLGYRGLTIEHDGELGESLPGRFRYVDGRIFGPDLAAYPVDTEFEDFICGGTGPLRPLLGREFCEWLLVKIRDYRDLILKPWPPEVFWPVRAVCKCGPIYEPAWWNIAPRQYSNNCYNYASNYRTDTFAQPGQAAGAMYASLSCADVLAGAIADELIDSAGADNDCPADGHLVALVVDPGNDFHWYRKGRNGRWTHKPGGTAVTNLDNSGVAITDPRTANRDGYTDFCTFMVVMHGHIKIT